MSSNLFSSRLFLAVLTLLLGVGLLVPMSSVAQTTVSTGSIVGTVTDPSGAVVNDAKVVITNTENGQVINLSTNSAGAFNSGALQPGSYKVHVSTTGFNSVDVPLTVQVGNTSTANVKLQVGQESQVVEVQGSQLQVNTEQAEVQGVLTSAQIENLPVNGRNFLDLAQLEPGVQIQDGQNFDPTKAGYSSISFGGRFGRTARIFVDGVDISDETVGTTTEDIPASAIDEFQITQSSLDLSNDLTSSGAVNVTTKSGTNKYHGEAFGLFRDASVGGASSPGGSKLPFQRSQYGGNLGGAIIKDKLFFFADGERIKQDSFAPVQFTDPFRSLNGGFSVPFRDNELFGRVDYVLPHNAKLFYRYSYFGNSLPSDFGLGYSVYVNKDYTRNHVIGVDFNTGGFTHTIRLSYLKFQNQIVDIVKGSSLPFANTGVTIKSSPTGLYLGPSPLAPQSTPQANRQVKYDGSKAIHSHILRYGASFNHIQGGGFASFFGTAPRISWTTNAAREAFAADSCDPAGATLGSGPPTPCYPGGISNPLNYPVSTVLVGNGQGFNTLQPALGFPAGGLGPDNRLGLYLGDGWKVKPNFTVNIGVRYDRDSGRTDSDLGTIPEINAQFPGFGNPVKQPNFNIAPQLGIAWDPSNNGKTVIRAGIGLFYENVIYNNVLFDRPFRLKTGAFNLVSAACAGSIPQPVAVNQATNASGFITPGNGVCSDTTNKNPNHWIPVGQAIPNVLSFWNQVLAGNPLDLKAPNPNYIGNFLSAGLGVPLGPFAPNYKTPRSVQINAGIQHEFHPGTIFSADYLRNVETHSLIGIDVNHVGDVSNFNLTAAQNAIAATNTAFGCPDVACAIAAGAQMTDYASNGLTADTDFGQACIQAIGVPCAFGGRNPNQSAAFFLQPIGRSVYNALQMKLVHNVVNPFRGVKAANFQVAYSLSRYENSGGSQVNGTSGDSDQDFVVAAIDNNKPNRFFGPSLLDRTHQISFGGYTDLPGKFRLGFIGHFYSPLSSPLVAPSSGNLGEIFRTDFTGDGTVQDPLPGTHLGQFGRGINASNLNSFLNSYNSNVANQPTPAGQVLVANGLFTVSQLQALGGVAPKIPSAVNQVNFTWLRSFDLNLGWNFTIKERFTIEPSVAAFNVFNFSNFNLPPNTMSGLLTGSPGSINGTDRAANESFRVGNGTGVYAVGAARQIEWGLKFTF
ncbi:MAG: hypothetical protein NVS1B11_19240 [Terriglobales bacterium]